MIFHRLQQLRVDALVALIALTMIFGFSSRPATAADNELVLAVQPILDEGQTRKAFQPLCDYLAQATGRPCRLFTSPNFYAYWDIVRNSTAFNLVLDAAHFTDYRVQKLGYQVLAKIPDSVSYSLVTSDSDFLVDASELVGKRVATLGIPSIGAARLNGLFPNPSRQPVTVEVGAAEQAIRMLLDGKLKAAILPTPLVAQQMANGGGLYVVLATDPIPHIGLSAAPSIDAKTLSALRQALLNAHTSEDGKKMLKQIGFERFDPATASVYTGQAGILKEYWGY
jgi:ABC-type phosphate/phosphonate transport system substrate-binding protein